MITNEQLQKWMRGDYGSNWRDMATELLQYRLTRPTEVGSRYRHKKRGSTYVMLGWGVYSEVYDLVTDGTVVGYSKIMRGLYSISHSKEDEQWATLQLRDRVRLADVLVLYRAEEDDSVWARPVKDFFDGRFELIDGTDHNEVPEAARDAARDAIWAVLCPSVRSTPDDLAVYGYAARMALQAALPHLAPQPPTEPTRAEDAPHVEPGGEREKLRKALKTLSGPWKKDKRFSIIERADGCTIDFADRQHLAAFLDLVASSTADIVALRSSRDAVLEEALRKIVDCYERNADRQPEKLADIPLLARRALKASQS